MKKIQIAGVCVLMHAILLLSAVAIEPVVTGLEIADMQLAATEKFLWDKMWEGGMLSDEQLSHVYAHGRLPGGTVLEESPLSTEKQEAWTRLAEHNVVGGEELAQMLMGGTIDGLSQAEIRAFEELAPVYEPDRRKRLAYDVRRKHIVVDMIRLKHRSHAEWEKSHAEALEWAERTDSPVKGETPDGGQFELMRMGGNGDPVYYITYNGNA